MTRRRGTLPRMSDDPTVFDRILAGEIPCHRLLEDDDVLAFLDVGPLSRGHALVIPRERAAHLHELSPGAAAALGAAVARVAGAVAAAVDAEGYNVLLNDGAAAGQEVPHVHFHVIPVTGGRRLEKRWTPGTLDDAEALVAAITARL